MQRVLKEVLRPGVLILVLLAGCAGVQRDCTSCLAQEVGADWVVVQVDMSGVPFRCWELRGVGIKNEPESDGIFWRDSETGNMVHISGLYNRVQVSGGNWDAAFAELGITQEDCRAIRAGTYSRRPAPQHGPSDDRQGL